MNVEPCAVCGGTDLNLVDGYYYCVECGTQDRNVQETVVEHTMLADGTFAHVASRKFTTLKDGIEMSGEWHKWHAYNFILAGLADELMELGAGTGIKMKVLWVWTRYIKKFQVKDDLETSQLLYHDDTNNPQHDKEKPDLSNSDLDEEKEKAKRTERNCKDIKIVTKGVLLAILYIALNLDQSEIQLSHLTRFIKEGRLSLVNCIKYVPQEINRKTIPHWKSFLCCTKIYTPHLIRALAMTMFKNLDLGTPLVPDLRKLIDSYVEELCLPNDFKDLVFSLMNLVPCDFLNIDSRSKKSLMRIPDFEVVAMSYVLIALKMCFGLDDSYEITLSDAVDKINNEKDYLKAYRLGVDLKPSGRLFSFRDWCNYLQFRKVMLCKHYLPIAQQHNLDVDDHVFMEHLGERNKRKVELSDEVTMDILNRIPFNDDIAVIPKSEFPPTLTPMSLYTDVIMHYIQDPELKLLISEDFTQYSLAYACKDVWLSNEAENLIKGVNDEDKTIELNITGSLKNNVSDTTMVYVRNCENKNWLKTNPPTIEHILKINDKDDDSDRQSDHGYDSNVESTPVGKETNNSLNSTEVNDVAKDEIKLEVIEEEHETINIFDDAFEDVDIDVKEEKTDPLAEVTGFEFQNDFQIDDDDKSVTEDIFNPETFDREGTIKDLILTACYNYKIPIPIEYNPRGPIKRKQNLVHIGAGNVEPKKRKFVNKRGEAKKEMERIIAAYYSNLESDILNKVSEEVKSFVQNFDQTRVELDETANLIKGDQSNVNYDNSYNNENEFSEPQINSVEDNDVDNLGSSILEINSDRENTHTFDPKCDPNFDEKTHDIKQLYVKFRDEFELDDLISDDPEIDKIIDKKLEECSKENLIELRAEDLKEPKKYESDSEDDLSLFVLRQEKLLLQDKKGQAQERLRPLIVDQKKLIKFKYWLRHYSRGCVGKCKDMQLKFDLELKENCPSSFNFVINECASILDCTAYSLYRCIQNLEKILVSKQILNKW